MTKLTANLGLATRVAHVEPLDTISRKIAPEHVALIVVDMQNDFCAPSGLLDIEGRDISDAKSLADRLPRFINAARAVGVLVVFIQTVYTTENNFYLSDSYLEQAARRCPDRHAKIPVCGADLWGGDFYGEVRPRPNEPVVKKHRYSAFHNTDLDTILRAHGVRTLIMTGVATNVCVAVTAHDGFMRDYYIVFPEDGTASYSRDEHDVSLRDIDRYFGEVTSIAEITSIWLEQSTSEAKRA